MRTLLASAILTSLLALPSLVLSHGGGLDAYGYRHNRKAGGHHCYRNPLAGRSARKPRGCRSFWREALSGVERAMDDPDPCAGSAL